MDGDRHNDLAVVSIVSVQGELNWALAVAFPNQETKTFEYSDVFLLLKDSFASCAVAVVDFDGNGSPG